MGRLQGYWLFFLGLLSGLTVRVVWRDSSIRVPIGALDFTGSGGSRAVDRAVTKNILAKNYTPSIMEQYVLDHADELGYNDAQREKMGHGCPIWTDQSKSEIYQNLVTYRQELAEYNRLLRNFNHSIKDLRHHLGDENDICSTLELHPNGLEGIFSKNSLSYSPKSGYVEPLLPPMRDPDFCFNGRKLLSMEYLVHDFAAMCRKLLPTSRTILVDMGASLDFHGSVGQPAIYLLHIFQKFGFHFDHVYAYEITQNEPSRVFELVPASLQAAYHWINVGVNPDPASPLNPLSMILDNYNEDDFIVVKLDIDTPSVEMPLANQLLNDPRFQNRVDSFYFEHHIFLKELESSWGGGVSGSIKDSLDLFHNLRRKGISAHSWV